MSRVVAVVALVLSTLIALQPAQAEVGEVIRVSESPDGIAGNLSTRQGFNPLPNARNSFSSDGKLYVFSSAASNLVPSDTNDKTDIFVYHIDSGQLELISLSRFGGSANGDSRDPSISLDGKFIAFSSQATDIVSSFDFGNWWDIFLLNRETGNIQRIAFTTGGGDRESPAISGDGKHIAFSSPVHGQAVPVGNGFRQVYVYNIIGGTTEWISLSPSGEPGDIHSWLPSISDDGNIIAFQSQARNLDADYPSSATVIDIFVHDRIANVTRQINISDTGSETSGSDHSWRPVVSGDGRFVAFRSDDGTLVSSSSGPDEGIYVYDRNNMQLDRVNVDDAGVPANHFSSGISISQSGRYIAFASFANNLVVSDTNDAWDVFVRDTLLSSTRRVSTTTDGEQTHFSIFGFSDWPFMRSDGTLVGFQSRSGNLDGDSGSAYQMFVKATGFEPDAGENTPTGTDVAVTPQAVDGDGTPLVGSALDLSFDDISTSGETTVTVSTEGPLVPTGFKLGDPPVYYDLETTALFSGDVEVCITYDEGAFADEENAQLFHFDDILSVWTDITSSRDTEANVICGTTSSFSTFVLAELDANSAPVADAGPDQTGIVATSAAGTDVILDGSGSSDDDGDELTYSWSGDFGSASGVSPTVSLPPGEHVIQLTVSDGVESDTDSVTITVKYAFGGFKPPMVDGAAYKLKRTLPVKFELTFSDGAPVANLSIPIDVTKIGDAAGVGEEADLSTGDTANSGTLFRYDEETQLYIFNLSTKGWDAGVYRVKAILNTSQIPAIEFTLK